MDRQISRPALFSVWDDQQGPSVRHHSLAVAPVLTLADPGRPWPACLSTPGPTPDLGSSLIDLVNLPPANDTAALSPMRIATRGARPSCSLCCNLARFVLTAVVVCRARSGSRPPPARSRRLCIVSQFVVSCRRVGSRPPADRGTATLSSQPHDGRIIIVLQRWEDHGLSCPWQLKGP